MFNLNINVPVITVCVLQAASFSATGEMDMLSSLDRRSSSVGWAYRWRISSSTSTTAKRFSGLLQCSFVGVNGHHSYLPLASKGISRSKSKFHFRDSLILWRSSSASSILRVSSWSTGPNRDRLTLCDILTNLRSTGVGVLNLCISRRIGLNTLALIVYLVGRQLVCTTHGRKAWIYCKRLYVVKTGKRQT